MKKKIKKAIIQAVGVGKRFLHATKAQPKKILKKIILPIITLIFIFTILSEGYLSNGTKRLKESTKSSNKDIQSKLIKYMDDYSEKNEFSGTIILAKDDDVLLNRAYGMEDYDNNIANRTNTVFEIASITKQFTATAILMLQESKLLNVQDLISKYISDYPNGDKIKIYNLLTHTSGIPEYLNLLESMNRGKYTYSTEEIIELFKNKPLNFETGTSFEYSNSNYVLLGYIIEKVSKMKYEDYIEKKILKPLKLNKTIFLTNQDTIKDKAIGYNKMNKNLNIYTKETETESSLTYATAEICSTVEDLYRWENALYTGKLIKQESLNEMFTPYLKNYGYGWYIDKSSEGDKCIYHTGSLPGYTSYIGRNIDKKYVCIILSNKEKDESVNNIPIGLSQILENN